MNRPLLTALLLPLAPLAAEITLKEADGRMRVEIDGELFTEYRSDQRVPCLYPVISPSGSGLTRNYPLSEAGEGEETDHPHHVSVWFTHGMVNGVDFWAGHLKRKGRIIHKGFEPRPTGSDEADTASFSVRLSWEEGDKVHLSEQRTYTILAQGKTRLIDIESILTGAGGDTLFGDTKEGTSAFRVTPTLRSKGEVAKGRIINSNGERGDDAWGKRAKWVAYSGPDGSGEPAVVAMFDHPSNLRHPTWWHARDYGLLAANPFGQHDFEGKKDKYLGDHVLKAGEALTFRYRILLHHGELESAAIAEAWKAYAAEAEKARKAN